MRQTSITKRLRGQARALVIAAVALVLAGATVVVVLPAAIPGDLVRDRVNEELSLWTGGGVTLRSDARIAVRPGFRVRISHPVLIASDGGRTDWSATASAIEARLRVASLLKGRVEVAEIRVLEPEIVIAADARPVIIAADARPAAAAPRSLAGAPADADAPSARRPPGDIALVDGSVRLDEGPDETVWITDLNLRLSSPAAPGALSATASVFLGSHRLNADLRLDDPSALRSDAGAPGQLSIEFGPGPVADDADLAERGLRDIGTGLRRVAAALGLPGMGPVVIDGRFALGDHSVEIADATVSSGGVALDGHLRADLGRDAPLLVALHRLHGAADAAISGAAREIRDDGWAATPLAFDLPDGLGIDLGLSGESIALGTVALETAALSLSVRDGTAQLRLSGEDASLGRLRADLSMTEGGRSDGAAPRLTLNGQVADMAMDEAAELVLGLAAQPLIGAPQLPTGTLGGEVGLTTSGDTPREMLDALAGWTEAIATDGSLAGGDVITTLDSLARGREFMTDEKGPLIPAAGRTPFDRIEVRMDIRSGIADVSRLKIEGERFAIDLTGDLHMNGGAMNANGNAILLGEARTADTDGQGTVDLPFGLGGTLFDPVVAPGVPRLDVDALHRAAGTP